LLCTQGLAYLLQDSSARSAFTNEITARTGIEFNSDLTWHAEAHQESDRGRPDLEARTADGTPIVKIEAKLGAAFDANQFRSYVEHLHDPPAGGVLLVLVPAYRVTEATQAVNEAFGVSGDGLWRPTKHPGIVITVITWDDVLAALGGGGSEWFRCELAGFQAMYTVLSGDLITPIASREELIAWREREVVFVNLVDRVTRRLTTEHNVYPMGVEPPDQTPEGLEPKGYHRRYVCHSLGQTGSCFSIGVRDPFKNHITPIWMRFAKETGQFAVIRDRLASSDFASTLVESGGHVWILLDVPLNADGEEMVDSLVAQAEHVIGFAYQPMP